MIVVSILLILVAVAMLVLGLWQASSALLTGSIAASLIAAIALVIGARRAAAGPAEHPDGAAGPAWAGGQGYPYTCPEVSDRNRGRGAAGPGRRVAVVEPATLTIPVRTIPVRSGPVQSDPVQGCGGSAQGVHEGAFPQDEAEPPDEPAPQQVSPAEAARVARMSTEVLVVDGRPRYHLPGCVHLLGRDSEPLPVGEVVELGFSPCSLCEPDSALLADVRRV